MKIFKTNKMIFTALAVTMFIAGISVIQSCGNNADFDIKDNNTSDKSLHDFSEVTPENNDFKALLLNTKNIVKLKSNINSNGRKNAPSIEAEIAINKQMRELTIASMKMLKSYGYEYKDISQYVDSVNDPKIALMGMIFVALQKCNKNNSLTNNTGLQITKRYKAKNTEDNPTFTLKQVKDCLLDATGLSALADGVFGSATYFTLETAMGIAGRVACRTLGVIGAAYAIVDFGDCMGWYNIW